MSDQAPRFFLRVPASYHELTEEEQKAAAVAMWANSMRQLGEDADRLIGERTAQNENPDDGS